MMKKMFCFTFPFVEFFAFMDKLRFTNFNLSGFTNFKFQP